MKKFTIAALFISALTITACHYGQDEAKETIERNELYKTDKADYSVNRAGEGGKLNAKTEVKADTTVATKPAETTAAPEHPQSK